MNKILLALFVTGSMLFTAPAWAAENDQVVMSKADQAIIAKAAQNMVTVAQAKRLPDNTLVTLTGVIAIKTHKNHFELKDSSGKIGINLDSKLWRSMHLTAGDKVKVVGKVDTHNGRPTDIDALQIAKRKNPADQWSWFHRVFR